MEGLKETLRAKRLNKYEIEQIGNNIGTEEAKIARMLQLAESDEMPLSWHAWWVCEHIAKHSPTAFIPHRESIVNHLLQTQHEGKMRLILNVLLYTQESAEISVALLNFCLDNMLSPTRSVAVQASCMRLAYKLCLQEPALLPELQSLLEEADPSFLTAATLSSRRNILKKIKKGR